MGVNVQNANRYRRIGRAIACAAVAALGLGFAAQSFATTTLYSTGFEEGTVGQSITAAPFSFFKDGSASAVVNDGTTIPGSSVSGKGVTVIPPAATSGTWAYKINAIADPASTAEPVVTASADFNVTSPASGTANKSVFYGLQMYDNNVALLADILLFWDAENAAGAGANHMILFVDWANDATTTADDGGTGFDLGVFTSAQLSTIGFSNLAISLDYSTGTASFFLDGTNLATDIAQPTPFSNAAGYSDSDIYISRFTTGGTLPRFFLDNYSVTTSAVPEPVSAGALALVGTGVVARRRRA